ncbi:MAG: ATP-binding protein [Actinomycetota bacterium]|nr:ATP-binding protein [Actinomycetota bacterium]
MTLRPPPAHRVTSATLQAAYPFIAGGSLGAAGVYIGRDLYGSAFAYDPFLAYEAGLIGSPNMIVMGQLGRGKSTFVKSYLWRQLTFGRQAQVFDVKGEYGPLCDAVGATPLRLRPGGRLRLNPLDPGTLAQEESARATFGRQLALATALAEQALTRPLQAWEHAACYEALRALGVGRSVTPTLPDLVDELLAPGDDAARALKVDRAEAARESRAVALALRRLVHGDLAGMFDGPTTNGLDVSADLVVMDLSQISDAALGLIMTCATAWLQTRLSAHDGVKRIVVMEEAWRVLADLGVARWMQQAWKLARQYGVQYCAVLHRLSDLDAAGHADSEQVRLARGLIHDVETRVVYGQSDSEVPATRELLGLSDTEARLLPGLGKGVALWKIADRSFLVQHRLGHAELAIVDTNAAMSDNRTAV